MRFKGYISPEEAIKIMVEAVRNEFGLQDQRKIVLVEATPHGGYSVTIDDRVPQPLDRGWLDQIGHNESPPEAPVIKIEPIEEGPKKIDIDEEIPF